MKKSNAKNVVFNVIICILSLICVFVIAFKLTFVNVTVYGSSMNPSIDDGSKGYMIKVNKNTPIKRFDVVVSEYDNIKEGYIIKRVLGLPNEKIKLTDNKLYVNDVYIEQEFSFTNSYFDFTINEWTLKDDEYLLVGDNRVSTIPPTIAKLENIIAKNGFSYLTYDVNSNKCNDDYSSCEIKTRDFYFFKNGKGDN